MVQLLSGVITGGVVFSLAIAFLWKEVLGFDRNFRDVQREFLKELGRDSKIEVFGETIDLKETLEETKVGYKAWRNKRMKNTMLRLALIAAILGLLGAYVAHLLLGNMHMAVDLFPIPVLVAGAILCFMFTLESEKCCVHESSTASCLKLWLGLILPSVPKGGEIRIVRGSMHPYPFSIKPIFGLLDWLRREKEVTIELLSGEPDFNNMKDWQYKEWEKYWSNIHDYGFQNNVHILPERPQLQYTLTNKLVRIEKEHLPWISRQRKHGNKVIEEHVANHIHMFDYFLIWIFRAKFKRIGKSAKPVLDLEPPQTKIKE